MCTSVGPLRRFFDALLNDIITTVAPGRRQRRAGLEAPHAIILFAVVVYNCDSPERRGTERHAVCVPWCLFGSGCRYRNRYATTLREVGHERPPLQWKDACEHLSRSSVARVGRVGMTVPFAMSAESAQTFAESLVATRCCYQSPASVCDECKMSPNGTVILACPPPQAVFKRRKSGRQSSRSAHQTRAAQQIPPLWST